MKSTSCEINCARISNKKNRTLILSISHHPLNTSKFKNKITEFNFVVLSLHLRNSCFTFFFIYSFLNNLKKFITFHNFFFFFFCGWGGGCCLIFVCYCYARWHMLVFTKCLQNREVKMSTLPGPMQGFPTPPIYDLPSIQTPPIYDTPSPILRHFNFQ